MNNACLFVFISFSLGLSPTRWSWAPNGLTDSIKRIVSAICAWMKAAASNRNRMIRFHIKSQPMNDNINKKRQFLSLFHGHYRIPWKKLLKAYAKSSTLSCAHTQTNNCSSSLNVKTNSHLMSVALPPNVCTECDEKRHNRKQKYREHITI